MKRASGPEKHPSPPPELPTCPACLLPVVPIDEEETLGPQCKHHNFQLHSACLAYLQAHGDGCPYCRPEIRALGRGAFGRLVCERMAKATEDVPLQVRGQAVLVSIAKKGREEIMALVESRGTSIACDNAGRGDFSLVRDALELICLVCRVWVNGQDIAGFTAACHVVAREMRWLYNPHAVIAGGNNVMLRKPVVSACLSLARLSAALALTLADDKIIDLLVRHLHPQADQDAQVESVVILATLSAHKPMASRLITSSVHIAALDLLPRVVSATAIVPITISHLAANDILSIGLSTAEELTNRDREAMLAARTQGSTTGGANEDERDDVGKTIAGAGEGPPPSKKDPKLTYLVSLLADLCEFGVPYEEMDTSSALCARLVKGVLLKYIDDHQLVSECCRAIIAIAAGSDDCAESLGRAGACEALGKILGLNSLSKKLLCHVLEGVHDLCQAECSDNQNRFLACRAPQKMAELLVSLSSLSSLEDPQSMMACLRAVRALARSHEANAHALGNDTMVQIKDVSKTFRNNQEVVAECGETIAVLTEAVCSGKSDTSEEAEAPISPGGEALPSLLTVSSRGKDGQPSKKGKPQKDGQDTRDSEAGTGTLPDLLRRDSAYDALQRAISAPPLSARRDACQLSSSSNKGPITASHPPRTSRGRLAGANSSGGFNTSSRHPTAIGLGTSGRGAIPAGRDSLPSSPISPAAFLEQSARQSGILGQSQSRSRAPSLVLAEPSPVADGLRAPLKKSGGSTMSTAPPVRP